MPTTEPEAWSHIADIATRLTAAGIDVTDHHAEEDDGHLSGLIEIGVADEPQDHAYSWHSEHGWRELTGPRTDWGPYNNVTDLPLGPDATVDEVIAEITGDTTADELASEAMGSALDLHEYHREEMADLDDDE